MKLVFGRALRPASFSLRRYVVLPKDFEKGYKANVKKSDSEFAFYQ